MTDLESAARQIEAAAQAFGSLGPERQFFDAWPAAFRALAEEHRSRAAFQQSVEARVDALTAPTQDMRRDWRSMAREAFAAGARDWLREWRWALIPIAVALMVAGSAVGAGVTWYVMRSHGVCSTAPMPVPGGVACWVAR